MNLPGLHVTHYLYTAVFTHIFHQQGTPFSILHCIKDIAKPHVYREVMYLYIHVLVYTRAEGAEGEAEGIETADT